MKQAVLALSIASVFAPVLAYAQTPAPLPRLLCLYFDLHSMDAEAQSKALQQAAAFVQSQAAPGDRISVMTYTTMVNLLQDFTDNREDTLALLRMIQPAGGGDTREPIIAADAQLAAIQDAVKVLGQLPDKKAMIYFSNGVRREGVDNQEQLHATIDAAIRANVAIYSVDARSPLPAVR